MYFVIMFKYGICRMSFHIRSPSSRLKGQANSRTKDYNRTYVNAASYTYQRECFFHMLHRCFFFYYPN